MDNHTFDSADILSAIFEIIGWIIKIGLFILVALAALGFIKFGISLLFA